MWTLRRWRGIGRTSLLARNDTNLDLLAHVEVGGLEDGLEERSALRLLGWHAHLGADACDERAQFLLGERAALVGVELGEHRLAHGVECARRVLVVQQPEDELAVERGRLYHHRRGAQPGRDFLEDAFHEGRELRGRHVARRVGVDGLLCVDSAAMESYF